MENNCIQLLIFEFCLNKMRKKMIEYDGVVLIRTFFLFVLLSYVQVRNIIIFKREKER